jgi:hypothetical protein
MKQERNVNGPRERELKAQQPQKEPGQANIQTDAPKDEFDAHLGDVLTSLKFRCGNGYSDLCHNV